ncbi:transposase [Clostridium sp. UBA7503]|uniref:transposase n=1 Tax=Clostridium sp. UBA7503 TaxID=1946377 RepID=UPI0032170A36
MARKLRIWYTGAIYHVMCRGNRKKDIFLDSEDYQVYLKIIKKVKEELDFDIYSYCLMTNHVHLAIGTKDDDIGNIMKKINMLYSIYFNRKYDLIGHLFQGRYRSELIQEDKYILEVSRYIHLNPLRANMVTNAQDYKWSSYSTYLGLSKEKIINTERILSYFGEINARKLYKLFIDNGIR